MGNKVTRERRHSWQVTRYPDGKVVIQGEDIYKSERRHSWVGGSVTLNPIGGGLHANFDVGRESPKQNETKRDGHEGTEESDNQSEAKDLRASNDDGDQLFRAPSEDNKENWTLQPVT